ncbi:hypothetical protein [Streptomyces sp. GESEQ-4]|uniref:hypothetical protein n=1 Tax=Streptomyces sp. GESEQ-4 TaxID=2812655 RepID=UPI001B318ADF|nr:hypothetical protein [Streptomyces sp. GESEQ-4]
MAATTTDRVVQETCLTALESRTRRPLPRGLGAPSEAPEEPLRAPVTDVPGLQSLPDALIDPATVVAARGTLRLALVDLVVEPEGVADREVLDRYVAAFENADMEALADGVHRAHSLQVLTVSDGAVARMTVFIDPELRELFGRFGLPEVIS